MTDLHRLAIEQHVSGGEGLRDWVAQQPTDLIIDAATHWLATEIRLSSRAAIRAVEAQARCAEPPPPAREQMAEEAERASRRIGETLAVSRERVSEMVRQAAARLEMEWTSDLLSSEIRMPDGRKTTWGAATVADHEERMAMFMDYATASVAGAAQHKHAADSLRSAGARTLSDMLNPRGAAA